MRFLPIVLGLGLLAGCAALPKTAPQGAYETEVSFVAALKTANAYAAMPRCSQTVKLPCSDQAAVNKMAAAASKADMAVLAVQKVSKDTASSASDVAAANAAAMDAIDALKQLTPAS